MHNQEEYLKTIQDKLLVTANKLIKDEINLIEGVRILTDCASKLKIEDDKNLLTLKAVDSNTDGTFALNTWSFTPSCL